MKQALFLAAALFVLAVLEDLAVAEDSGPTARGVFAQLPTTIFENTPAGLDEAGKQALLRTGRSTYWEIAGETPDIMVFAELPFQERAVALRLFPNEVEGGALAAIGTLGDPICTVELWNLDSAGRITPVDTPIEPAIGEFFSRRRQPPLEQQNSVLICLGLGGLWAKPVFWSEYGVTEPRVDNEISFLWRGNHLEKVKRPVAREPKKRVGK